MSPRTTTIPLIDLSAYQDESSDAASRQAAADALVQACHEFGFCSITGHGLSTSTVSDAFRWTKSLFDLPLEDKMKAPHPAAAKPHRGYSGIGQEKVYSRDEAEEMASDAGSAPKRTITDYKESYEIGSEDDPEQQNIWLPEDVLPGFRKFGLELYSLLNDVANTILTAFADGLYLENEADRESAMQINSQCCNQLRLLHYPEVDKTRLKQNLIARMPAHTDWGGFTLLFQDEVGGLELQDPSSKQWVYATPVPGQLILNIGDFFERVTNGHLKSALHRVSLPDSDDNSDMLPERYSIPYFVAPSPNFVGRCLDTFVNNNSPAKFETMAYGDYMSWREKNSY